jgi:hypothetical protein
VNSNCRAFLWENGAMTDLNALTLPGSPLFLISGVAINNRGEIAGVAVDQSGNALGFLAIPCDADHADDQGCQSVARDARPAMPLAGEQSKIILPENIRQMLQQRSGLRGPWLGR